MAAVAAAPLLAQLPAGYALHPSKGARGPQGGARVLVGLDADDVNEGLGRLEDDWSEEEEDIWHKLRWCGVYPRTR